MSITEREGTRAPVTTVISSNHAVVPRHMRELAPLLSIHPKGRLYYCIHFTEKEKLRCEGKFRSVVLRLDCTLESLGEVCKNANAWVLPPDI